MDGEARAENNSWQFETAVSDDRTNVLLVDDRPRWEFRYLRNLFYARDKSVHLQYVLTTPDRIQIPGQSEEKKEAQIAASASRPFGEAEADLLPVSREEWQKFDVIILGDLPPTVLDNTVLEHVRHCVTERGAMLVVIAGPYHMPHRFQSDILEELLPIRYEVKEDLVWKGPEPAFKLQLTKEGQRHPVMQLSPGTAENQQIWGSLPLLRWRHPVAGTKPGATVLAFAVNPQERQETRVTAGASIEETARKIDTLNAKQQQNALVAVQRIGRGKVLTLASDRTWRLRYRVGDTYHHRFWGQVLTWGAGENLRAGSQFVRLGTDKITYSPGDKIRVLAKVVRPDYTPIGDDDVGVAVYRGNERSHKACTRQKSDRSPSPDATASPLPAKP